MTLRIPAEWEPHACCWMAWAVHPEWGRAAPEVKRELGEMIRTISRYEPVRLLAPAGLAFREAQRKVSSCSKVTVIEAPVDDIWMRDIAPTFAFSEEGGPRQLVAIDWNFNGWGGSKSRPPRPGDRLARTAAQIFGVPRIAVGFVADAGAFITDGLGSVVATRSCLLNPNRNPASRSESLPLRIENELRKLGVDRVIWLEGDAREPLTSGHADGYVLCAPSGIILVEVSCNQSARSPKWRRERDIAVLESSSRLNGQLFEVIRVRAPRGRYWMGHTASFAPC